MKKLSIYLSFLLLGIASVLGFGQSDDDANKTVLEKFDMDGLAFRSVGPAFTSGRISDIAVNPNNHYEYYVATSSGGVWKTTNSGTTFDPLFDKEGSYSIGCVTIDPSNPNIIWVGTGENNNQRSVAYGDGIYKSIDGGKSWKNMGLKNSEHIGKIIVHPDNSDKIYVAAIGPLWNAGGDRGVYISNDGGETWNSSLSISQHTGVSDLIMNPDDPFTLYAAAFQRRRHVFTYLGGGPESGIYKSSDGGEKWHEVNEGLPEVDLGRIGLDFSIADPTIVYAIVEAAQDEGGFYASLNGGASWEKRSKTSTSGNYYQEIISDPIEPNTIYIMDAWMKVSTDGGKNFHHVGEDAKHVDNHSLWVDGENNDHWLAGCDGGIYETFDGAATWSYKANLPVTQFYKVAVDNDAPFYNIYGGTQDNFSIGGPSRTNTGQGIMNSDWYVTHGGDGFESQVDPNNPDIVYAQSQYGVLVRYDHRSGEEVGIQPKERKGENAYRWNWDAPLIASPHVSGRIYFAANKVFRSDDYGNSWEVLSEDLTQQINRNNLRVMDRTWSVDAVAKNRSTSQYGTIVAMSESPVNKDILVIGTDDGLIQVTTDGGATWNKNEKIISTKDNTYVNAVYSSQHDEKIIYAAFNHHKYGDFNPYLFKSTDLGKSWKNISSNLPKRGSIYSFEEDHINPDLLFCGTEFGVYFSDNGGQEWKQLKKGLPTIAVRDIAIQRRENDLVLGTFGRGFYVLDDYSSLRNIGSGAMADRAKVYSVRDPWLYEQRFPLGLPGKSFQGDNFYVGENLGSEALITYYFNEEIKSLKDNRRKSEKEHAENNKGNTFPNYEDYLKEADEATTALLFTIKNGEGDIIRKISKEPKKGLQRFKWDMRYAPKDAIDLTKPLFYNPFESKKEGSLVLPGAYTVEMALLQGDQFEELSEPQSFSIQSLDNTVLPASNRKEKTDFQRDVAELSRSIEGANHMISELNDKLKHVDKAIGFVELSSPVLVADARRIELKIKDLERQLNGDPLKTQLDIDQQVTPATRISWINYEQKYSTSSPTETHRASYTIAKEEFQPILEALILVATKDMPALEKKLEDADAPYTPGRAIRMLQGQ